MLDIVYEEAREKMGKSIEVLKKELARVRTGRASTALLEGIRADYYGTPTPLNQMATLNVPDPRTIAIQPWDPSAIPDIEKAIMKSDLGLTPTSDGKIIRINIPALTEQRRKELVKAVSRMCEEQKVAVRNIRRDANETLKTMKKDGDITEDEMYKGQDEIQKITDEHIKKIDEVCAGKEKEILEF
ncbi:MAG: ribosome recycling factor [Deltaproteobacteria bacterium]|nr:ribosome recycling factor [Deltaproteobacteria bacterium]